MLNRVAKKVYAQSFFAQSCFTDQNNVIIIITKKVESKNKKFRHDGLAKLSLQKKPLITHYVYNYCNN